MKFTAKDMRPFSAIEGDGLKSLVNVLKLAAIM